MKKETITVAQAMAMPEGTVIKRSSDGLFYKMHKDVVYEQCATPRSECKCDCHKPDTCMMHAIPCCSNDPETLYIVDEGK